LRKHVDDTKGKTLSDSEKTETFGIPRYLQNKGLTLESHHWSEMRNILANDIQGGWKEFYQGMRSTYTENNMPRGVSHLKLETQFITHSYRFLNMSQNT